MSRLLLMSIMVFASYCIHALPQPDPQKKFTYQCENEVERTIHQGEREWSQNLRTTNDGTATEIFYRNFRRVIRKGVIRNEEGKELSSYQQTRTTEKKFTSDNEYIEDSVVKHKNKHANGGNIVTKRRIQIYYRLDRNKKPIVLKKIVDGVEQDISGEKTEFEDLGNGQFKVVYENNLERRVDFSSGYVIIHSQKNTCINSYENNLMVGK